VAGSGVYLATRSSQTVPTPRDAAVVAVVPDASPAKVVSADAELVPIDAPANVPADAALVVSDAPRGHSTPTPRTRDAGVVVAPVTPDAAVAVAAGAGLITIKYKPGPYANIAIDGGSPLPGPIIKRKIAAGRHTISFIDPLNGDVLDTQTVTVTDGETLVVAQH
jgi:hypothetical protein